MPAGTPNHTNGVPGDQRPPGLADGNAATDRLRPAADGQSPPPALEAAHDHGRVARGRFTGVNRGGPGKPHARRSACLRRKLLEITAEDEFETVARTVLSRAQQGDLDAARLLFSYLLGKPGRGLQPDNARLPGHGAPGQPSPSTNGKNGGDDLPTPPFTNG
jgi:hypothetical protein